jgi:tRNA (guanine37-N1)-methyltransferase
MQATQALGRTAERRPDLLEGRALSKQDLELLARYRAEAAERDGPDGAAPVSGAPGS